MKPILTLAAGLCFAVVGLGQPAKSDKPVLPADLAAVPNDAFAFAHIKLADLWKNDALKDVRAILEKAGPKAIEAFDSRFVPATSTVERLTAYMPPPNFEGPSDANFVFLVTVSKPFDRPKFLKQLGNTKERKGRNGGFVVDEDEAIAVRFVDDRTMAFGTVDAIQHMVDNAPPQKSGPLSPAIELAAGTRPIVFGMNATVFPPQLINEFISRQIPGPLQPLFMAQSVTLSMDLEGDGHIHAKVSYADGNSADAAEKAVGVATEMAKGLIADSRKQLAEKVFGDGKEAKLEDLPEAAASLLGLGALQHAEDLLAAKPVKRSGDALTASVPLPPQFKSALGTAALAGSFLAPGVGRIREAAARAKSSNNLKQIALALHNYHDVNNGFPAAAVVDKKGKPQLSWRVLILPYIEQDELFKQFKLDEPWDSENNKKLIEKMPAVFELPNKQSKPGETHYRVFVGNDAFFDWIQPTNIAAVTDGLSNTLIVVEAAEGVPWTKPDELDFDPAKDLPKLGKAHKEGFLAALGDGSVRFIRNTVDARTLKAMITKSGGEVVPNN